MGTWLTRPAACRADLTVEVRDADQLLAAAERQLDHGADLVKLYHLDGPDPDTSPWSANEVRRVVRMAHDRGAQVTAHAGRLSGARSHAGGRRDRARLRARPRPGSGHGAARNVPRLDPGRLRSWLTFGRTTRLATFRGDGAAAIRGRLERAEQSVALAARAGVPIAAGTDFGGGSLRANQLAWEVEALVAAGLEPFEALRAATPAERSLASPMPG